MRSNRTGSNSPVVWLLTLILIIQVLLVIYPIAFTVSSSFNRSNSLSSSALMPFHYIDKDGNTVAPSLYQYKRLFTETNYLHWYKNTLLIACMNTVLTVKIGRAHV